MEKHQLLLAYDGFVRKPIMIFMIYGIARVTQEIEKLIGFHMIYTRSKIFAYKVVAIKSAS